MKTIMFLATVSVILMGCGSNHSSYSSPSAAAPEPASTVTPPAPKPETSMECLQTSAFNVNTGHYMSTIDGQLKDCLADHELFLADGYFGNRHLTDCNSWSSALGLDYMPVTIDGTGFCFALPGIQSIVNVGTFAPEYTDPAAWTARPPVVSECTDGVDCSADARCANTTALGLSDGESLQICF